MDKKKIFRYILSAEILILLMLVVLLVVQWRSNEGMDLSIADWQSEYIEYDGVNGWNAKEELLPIENTVNIISGPFIELKKGTYRIKIAYHCDVDQVCLESAGFGRDSLLKSGNIILSKNRDEVSYEFEAKEDIESFELVVQYNGQGNLQITNISITRTAVSMLRAIFIVLFLSVCFDLCLLFSDQMATHKNTLAVLFGILVLTSLPLFIHGIGRGHDILFHLMRIEGIAEELKQGHIPVKLSSLWMDGFGYPTSVYYGDLLLYVPALMRILGFSVTGAYKFYVVMVNAVSVAVTYWCMAKIFCNRRIALLTCMAYCTSCYRLVCIYERAAVGEYSAMMFLPVVALAVYKIYTDDVADEKTYRKNAFYLALGMSGLIGTHVLSVEMTVFLLIVVALSLAKLTFRKVTLKVYCIAVALTCAWSAYFVIPCMDYLFNVPTKIGNDSGLLIQNRAPSINDYFSFFINEIQLTPGLLLMAALVAGIGLWISHKGNRMLKLLTVYSCFALYVASNLFPWDHLVWNYKLGDLLAQVQIPWRYIGIAVIFLVLLLGNIMQQVLATEEQRLPYERAAWIVGCLMVFLFNGSYGVNVDFNYYYDGAEINTYSLVGGEYVREGTDVSSITSSIDSKNMREASILSRKGSSMELRCVAEDEGFVQIPMFNYKGYHATDEHGKEYPIIDGANNQILIEIPAGFDGTILVAYKEPWYWRLAEIVSLVSLLLMCVGKGLNRYHRKVFAG